MQRKAAAGGPRSRVYDRYVERSMELRSRN